MSPWVRFCFPAIPSSVVDIVFGAGLVVWEILFYVVSIVFGVGLIVVFQQYCVFSVC